MIDQAFVNSNFTKLEKYFFLKKLVAVITVLDKVEDSIIDNVVYLRIEDGYVGIYIKGSNPYFSPSFIEDIDAFNLYENYEQVATSFKNVEEFTISSIYLVANEDYNEVMGIYLTDELESNSFSVVFTYDKLFIFEGVSFNEYLEKISQTLRHIERKVVFQTRKLGIWEIITIDSAFK